MAISNYSELKQEVIDWSHREDIDLKIDNFIQLAEAEMLSNPVSRLKVRPEETRSTASLSITERYLALPDRFKEMRRMRLTVNGESCSLDFRTPLQLRIRSATGVPEFFTVTSQLEFDRVADIAYVAEMQYFADLPAITSVNTTNSILTSNPNIYLFGCLWAAFRFGNDTEIASSYYSQFISAINGANLKDRKSRFGPGARTRKRGSTP